MVGNRAAGRHIGGIGTLTEDVVFVAVVDIAEFTVGIAAATGDEELVALAVDGGAFHTGHAAGKDTGQLQGNLFGIGVQDSEIVAAGRFGIGEAARHGADRHHEDVTFIRAADVIVARWWGGRLLRSRGLLWVGGLLRVSRGVVVAAAAAASSQQEGGGDTQSEGLQFHPLTP